MRETRTVSQTTNLSNISYGAWFLHSTGYNGRPYKIPIGLRTNTERKETDTCRTRVRKERMQGARTYRKRPVLYSDFLPSPRLTPQSLLLEASPTCSIGLVVLPASSTRQCFICLGTSMRYLGTTLSLSVSSLSNHRVLLLFAGEFSS